MVELDSSLLAVDLDKFQANVRRAYVNCSQAVNDELARHQGNGVQAGDPQSETSSGDTTTNTGNGNGAAHRASQKQLDYASQPAGHAPSNLS